MNKMPDELYELLEQCVLVIYNETDKPTGDYGKTEHSSHRIPIFRRLMISTCTMVSVTGAAFNLALICALLKFRNQTLHNNITNLFVLCLAVSDIFLCSVSMPLQMFYEINEHQMASTGLCRVLFAGFGLPLNISCLSILLIAFDRYRMIVHPMKIQMSTRVAIGLIGFVILFGMINSVPVALYVTNTNLTDYSYCVENWPSSQLRLAYSVSVFMLYFVLPLTASGGFYLCVYCKLARHATQLRYRKEVERRKRRTTSLLVATVVCFVLCWTPWCLYSLLLEIQSHLAPGVRIRQEWNPYKTHIFQSLRRMQVNAGTCAALLDQMTSQLWEPKNEVEIIPGRHIKLIDLFCKMFAMGSTCVNPVLYGWLNEPIQCAMRRQFGRMIDCCKRIPRAGHTERDTAHPAVTRANLCESCCWPHWLGSIRSRNSYEVRSKLVLEPPTVNNQHREDSRPYVTTVPSLAGTAQADLPLLSSTSNLREPKNTVSASGYTSQTPPIQVVNSTEDKTVRTASHLSAYVEQNAHIIHTDALHKSVSLDFTDHVIPSSINANSTVNANSISANATADNNHNSNHNNTNNNNTNNHNVNSAQNNKSVASLMTTSHSTPTTNIYIGPSNS